MLVQGQNKQPFRSHLKNRILVQSQGGLEFQSAGILKYFEDLKQKPNAGFGPKDIFEIASSTFRISPASHPARRP